MTPPDALAHTPPEVPNALIAACLVLALLLVAYVVVGRVGR